MLTDLAMDSKGMVLSLNEMYGPSGKAKTFSHSLDTAGVQIPNFMPWQRKLTILHFNDAKLP